MKHYVHLFIETTGEHSYTSQPFLDRAPAKAFAESETHGRNLRACVSIWEDPQRAVNGDVNFSPEWLIQGIWHKPGAYQAAVSFPERSTS